MKKTYMSPAVEVLDCETESLMDASGVVSDKGIDYGGVDEEGERDPEARPLYEKYQAWDDDEEEEEPGVW